MLFCLFNLTEYYINSNRSLPSHPGCALPTPPLAARQRRAWQSANAPEPGSVTPGTPKGLRYAELRGGKLNVGGLGSPGGYILNILEANPAPGRQHAVFYIQYSPPPLRLCAAWRRGK